MPLSPHQAWGPPPLRSGFSVAFVMRPCILCISVCPLHGLLWHQGPQGGSLLHDAIFKFLFQVLHEAAVWGRLFRRFSSAVWLLAHCFLHGVLLSLGSRDTVPCALCTEHTPSHSVECPPPSLHPPLSPPPPHPAYPRSAHVSGKSHHCLLIRVPPQAWMGHVRP